MELFIRKISIEDAATLSGLSLQLGYSLSVSETSHQVTAILLHPDHKAWVAEADGKVVGWIHAFKTLRLESLPFVEIGGLVIDKIYRGKGVGKALTKEVEKWCRAEGILTLRVRSNVKRNEAHVFYGQLGFLEDKEQKVFSKDLGPLL